MNDNTTSYNSCSGMLKCPVDGHMTSCTDQVERIPPVHTGPCHIVFLSLKQYVDCLFHCPYHCTQLAPKDCVVLLVGTYTPVEESDDESRKAVTTQVAEAYTAQKGLTYVECNPLDPEAVSRVITHLLAQVVR